MIYPTRQSTPLQNPVWLDQMFNLDTIFIKPNPDDVQACFSTQAWRIYNPAPKGQPVYSMGSMPNTPPPPPQQRYTPPQPIQPQYAPPPVSPEEQPTADAPDPLARVKELEAKLKQQMGVNK
jgi:hypothetical protein